MARDILKVEKHVYERDEPFLSTYTDEFVKQKEDLQLLIAKINEENSKE